MRNSFTLTYILLVIAQMLLCNYFHFTPYIMLTILPAMVFCLPTRISPAATMLIAFVTGLAVDYLAEGTLGINAMSLVPAAFLRKPLTGSLFGVEPFEQKENVTIKKYGLGRVSFALMIETGLFLLIYILADCAGTRPFWFIATRFGMSLLASYFASVLIINLLTYDNRR